MHASAIRGFNYQPSNGTTGLELWRDFDPRLCERELRRGKAHFPGMNAIRWWLSWDAFKRDPRRTAADFTTALELAEAVGCRVMPVLFNRWHDAVLDYGGVYADHFVPGASWVQAGGMWDAFLEATVGAHADDPRIWAWDLCNEPFAYHAPGRELPDLLRAETAWLEHLHAGCRRLGATAPITVGVHQGDNGLGLVEQLERVAAISDILSIHPYWIPRHLPLEDYARRLDAVVAYAAARGKPLIATETCWGAIDDHERTGIVRATLGLLRDRGIGWFAYLLHESRIADAHCPAHGPMGYAGDLSFVRMDGSLRPGHGVFNEFP